MKLKNDRDDVDALQSENGDVEGKDAMCADCVKNNIQDLLECVGCEPPPPSDPIALAEYLWERADRTIELFGNNIAKDRWSWYWLPEIEPKGAFYSRLTDKQGETDRKPLWISEHEAKEQRKELETAKAEIEDPLAQLRQSDGAIPEGNDDYTDSVPVVDGRSPFSPSGFANTVDLRDASGGYSLGSDVDSPQPSQSHLPHMAESDAHCEFHATLQRGEEKRVLEEKLTHLNATLQKHWTAYMERLLSHVYFRFTYKNKACDGRAIHMAVLNTKMNEEAEQLLRRLLSLRADTEHGCQMLMTGQRACVYPIHIAAGYGNAQLLKVLIEHKADVNLKTKLSQAGQIIQRNFGTDDSDDLPSQSAMLEIEEPKYDHYTALHECAFFKRVKPSQILIEARAEVDASNINGESVLHIAAKQGAFQVADLLVKSKADLQTCDKEGKTPLARAVEHGNFPMRKLFILARRSVKDLILVAEMSPPASAELMVDADDNRDNSITVHPQWRAGLINEAAKRAVRGCVDKEDTTVGQWCKLMRIAPQAGEYFLEALTMTPDVQDKNYHPLPMQANLRASEIVRSKYLPPMVDGLPMWCSNMPAKLPGKCPRAPPKWQTHHSKGLAPKATDRSQSRLPTPTSEEKSQDRRTCWGGVARALDAVVDSAAECMMDRFDGPRAPVRVELKVVMIRDLLCQEVFYVLKSTPHLHIFTKVAVRAIIETAWHQTVSHFYYSHVLYRLVEILTLLVWVLSPPPDGDNVIYVRMSWSFLFAGACQQAFYEFLEIRGFFWLMVDGDLGSNDITGKVMRFFENWMTLGNACDLSALGGLMLMCLMSFGDQRRFDDHKELLAFVVLTRWIQLLIAFRAFSWVGQKLLPIFQSTRAMGGIFCVTAFSFLGFLHAFWAMAGPDMSVRGIFVNAVRFLLLQDGNGIDMVLSLGTPDGSEPGIVAILLLLTALFSFTIWIMNLFIAGVGQAYDQALEYAQARFLQERASICLLCMFRPSLHWVYRAGVPSIVVRFLQIFVILPVWVFLCGMSIVPPWLPSVVLWIGMVVGEAMLMHHPWAGHRELQAMSRGLKKVGCAAPTRRMSPAQSNEQLLSSDGFETSRPGPSLPGSLCSPSGASPPSRDTTTTGSGGMEPTTSRSEDFAHQPMPESIPMPNLGSSLGSPRDHRVSGQPPAPSSPHPSQAPHRCAPNHPPPQMALSREMSSPVDVQVQRTHENRSTDGLFLWICHREDYDEMDYWPSNTPAAEKLEGRVSALKRDGMYRSRRTLAEVASVKRRTDRLFDWVHTEVRDVRSDVARVEIATRKQLKEVERKMDRRLDKIELLLSQLALTAGGVANTASRSAGGPAGGGGSGSLSRDSSSKDMSSRAETSTSAQGLRLRTTGIDVQECARIAEEPTPEEPTPEELTAPADHEVPQLGDRFSSTWPSPRGR